MEILHLYLILDISFVLTALFLIFPEIWYSVRKTVGNIKWNKTKHSRLPYKIAYMLGVSLVLFVLFPVIFIPLINNRELFVKYMADAYAQEIK